jgi:hypothetical protein
MMRDVAHTSGSDSAPESADNPVHEPRFDPNSQVKLAEFASLRAETDRRANAQWNVFALQITSAGAIAGVAISSPSNYAIMLLVPFSSYMLGSRYILHDFHLKLIQRYISESLSPRLNGELKWGSWKAEALSGVQQRPWFDVVSWNVVHPTRLAFEGLALLALVGVAVAISHMIIFDPPAWYATSFLIVFWILGLVLTYLLHRSFDRASYLSASAP